MKDAIILDVREKDEFEAERIEHSVHIPMSQFLHLAPTFLQQLPLHTNILLMCRGGNRAKLVQKKIEQLGFGSQVHTTVFEGGILEWKRQGKAIVKLKKSHLPIMRQVQLVAGLMISLSILLGYFVDSRFNFLALFGGLGLTLAGSTGFCGLAFFFDRMPWNRTSKCDEVNTSCRMSFKN